MGNYYWRKGFEQPAIQPEDRLNFALTLVQITAGLLAIAVSSAQLKRLRR
jgi:hypothetical protein